MLKYIWTVTQDLFLTVTFVSLMHALLGRSLGRKGYRANYAGIILGVLASVVFAYFKNTSNRIISSLWNHRIYGTIMICTLLFALCALILIRSRRIAGTVSEEAVPLSSFSSFILCVSGAALTSIWIFYRLPGVLGYPFNFNTMGNGYLSWYYIQRLLGWMIALLILVIYAHLLYKCAMQIKSLAFPKAALILGTLWNAFYCFCYFFVPWVSRAKWLKWPVKYTAEQYGWVRNLTQFASSNSMLFIWVVVVLVLMLVFLFFWENTRVTEPYDNPAQHRKLRARNRGHRRLAAASVLFLALITVSLSVVKRYDTRVIELSPPEIYSVEGDEILVPMDSVADGHLHRFEYKTENNVDIRWIIVKKPGSASFGVGLDACEVCGNAGYFERNGQVVCKRCDVVMNINTIGFKGGCNPIPLSYEVREGYLVFRLADILAGEREFR